MCDLIGGELEQIQFLWAHKCADRKKCAGCQQKLRNARQRSNRHRIERVTAAGVGPFGNLALVPDGKETFAGSSAQLHNSAMGVSVQVARGRRNRA
jgi:hypothetical protein